MKKFTAQILTLALTIALIVPSVFATALQNVTPVSLSQALDIKVSGGGTFVLQGTSKDTVGKSDDGSNTAVYVFDLRLEKLFDNNGKMAARFKGGRGLGLNKTVQTYAVVNSVADHSLDSAANTLAKITELFYQQSFFNDKLTANFGKLDFGAYFAENKYSKDKSSQFITSIFTADKIVEAPPQHVALRFKYNLTDKVDLSYAYFTTDIDHIDADGFSVIQAAYKPSKAENYLVYAWTNNKNHYSCKNLANKSGVYGFGLSADHELSDNLGIFGRVAYKDSSVTTLKDPTGYAVSSNLKLPLSLSWDAGVQVKGSYWSRSNDAAGFAIGQMYGSPDYQKYVDSNYKDGAETELELYYKFWVNKYLTISPAVQYFINPRGGNADNKGDVFVCGIRTRMSF
jgi:carbohydrate-selective porin OprB